MKYNPNIHVKEMINDMKNGVRNDIKNNTICTKAIRVVLMINKMKKYLDLMHFCVLMHRGILIFLHDSTDVYAMR